MKNGRYFDLDPTTIYPAAKPAAKPAEQPTGPVRFEPAEHFGPRIIGLRTAGASEFSDDGEPL